MDLDCYRDGNRMVLDLVWQRYDMASDFMKRERKGERKAILDLRCRVVLVT
jgi:hypothetical protein